MFLQYTIHQAVSYPVPEGINTENKNRIMELNSTRKKLIKIKRNGMIIKTARMF